MRLYEQNRESWIALAATRYGESGDTSFVVQRNMIDDLDRPLCDQEHGRSSQIFELGPMAGFVPCDPAFSKKCEGKRIRRSRA